MSSDCGGSAVIKSLEDYGITTIFGIPGIHTLEIYKALAGDSIRHITPRHEQGAGFMADGYARVTGLPGVALVITGPGLTNILTPMAQAYHDSIPMLVISSQTPRDSLDIRRGALHELLESSKAAKAASKESIRVQKADDIYPVIHEALDLSIKGRPGPVHVEIPLDLLSAGITESYDSCSKTAETENGFIEDLGKASEIINAARRPVIILGGGAWPVSKDFLVIAEKIAAPVLQTAAGKGIVDERHPLCLGTRLHFPCVREYLARADAVLAAGTELSPTDLWSDRLEADSGIIHLDIDEANFGVNAPLELGIKADIKSAVPVLLEKLNYKKGRKQAEREVFELISASRKDVSQVTGLGDELPMMLEMLDGIRKALPEDGILFTDMTGSAYAGLSEYPAYKQGTYFHPVGYGTLGHALPAAIGAKIASSEKPVCVLAGDGGFQFTLPELAVARQENIPLPIVIHNDGGFGEIRRAEKTFMPGRRIAVDHWNPDFAALAGAYGLEGRRVRTGLEVGRAVSEALNERKTILIEMITEP